MTKIAKLLNLGKHDHVLTAYCEPCADPGWSNTPLWVIIQDGDGKLRISCLQPGDQPPRLRACLYDIASTVHRHLMAALTAEIHEDVIRGRRKK